MPLKIVSGGQTGVDRGALDAALAAGAECGGWCPAGRLAEDGRIPDRSPLTELPNGGYAERTERNVADSDATLIIAFGEPEGGTRATIDFCLQHQRPYAIIDASGAAISEATNALRTFIDVHRVHTLNIAGPRATEAPGAYDYAVQLISALLGDETG